MILNAVPHLCRSRRKETLITSSANTGLLLHPLLQMFLTLALTGTSLLAAPPTIAEIDKTVATAAAYQSGQSLEPFRQIEDWVRQSVAEPAQRNKSEEHN